MKNLFIIILLAISCNGFGGDTVEADLIVVLYNGSEKHIHVRKFAFHQMDSDRHFFLDEGCVKYASSNNIVGGFPNIICGVSTIKIENFKRLKNE
jgi:hypothetical protein